MSDQPPNPVPPRRLLRQQDFHVGLATALIGAVGLLDIAYGDWSEGPAIGPHAFPQITYIALIAAGIGIVIDAIMGRGDTPISNMRAVLVTGVGVSGGGVAMFWMANVLGFGVAVGATLIAAAFLLIPDPLKRWPTTILVPVVSTAVIYVMFVLVIGVPLRGGILF